jgi:hypothetical protein
MSLTEGNWRNDDAEDWSTSDEARIAKESAAVQPALINTLRVPREDFAQLIFALPKNRFLHTPHS